MSLKKLCRCGAIINLNQKYCDKCTKEYKENKREKNRAYDSKYRKNNDVYKDKTWKKLTNACKNKFDGIDIYILYKEGKIKYGALSHHVIEVEEDKSKAYYLNNLIWVTDDSHREIHAIYRKGEEEKKRLQQILFDMIKKYEEEYK